MRRSAVALLLALAFVGVALLVRRRSPDATQRGPVWNCGFIDPPPIGPFGDPLTQPGAGGIAQPLRRMLGHSLLRAHESVDMPRPGETRAGHYAAGFADPSGPLLLAPVAALRDRIAAQAERLRDLTIRAMPVAELRRAGRAAGAARLAGGALRWKPSAPSSRSCCMSR